MEIDADASLSWFEMGIEGDEVESSTGGSVTGTVGYFFASRFDFGGFLNLSYRNLEGDGRSYALSGGPSLRWHFRTDTKMVPFVGAGAGLIHQDSELDQGGGSTVDFTESGWIGFAAGGVDLFVTPSVAVKLQMRYEKSDTRDKREFGTPTGTLESEVDITREQVSVTAGLAFFARRAAPVGAGPVQSTGQAGP